MLVAYIVLGALAGPHGVALVNDTALLAGIAEIGIIFLLFLVGLDLPTQKLKNMLGESLLTALGTTAVFFSAGALVMLSFGFSTTEAVIVGIGVTFFQHDFRRQTSTHNSLTSPSRGRNCHQSSAGAGSSCHYCTDTDRLPRR